MFSFTSIVDVSVTETTWIEPAVSLWTIVFAVADDVAAFNLFTASLNLSFHVEKLSEKEF